MHAEADCTERTLMQITWMCAEAGCAEYVLMQGVCLNLHAGLVKGLSTKQCVCTLVCWQLLGCSLCCATWLMILKVFSPGKLPSNL